MKDRPNEVKMFMAARHFAVKYAVNMREAKEHLLSNSSLTEDQKKIANSLWNEGENEFVYPFVQSDRFLHWIQNTCERHRAMGQRSFWLSKNSDYSNLYYSLQMFGRLLDYVMGLLVLLRKLSTMMPMMLLVFLLVLLLISVSRTQGRVVLKKEMK